MKSFILIITLALFQYSSYAQEDVKNLLANELIETAKIRYSVESSIDILISKYRKANPNIPPAKWIQAKNEINQVAYIEGIQKIYMLNYTESELELLTELLKNKKNVEFAAMTKKVQKPLLALSQEFGKIMATKFNSLKR